MRKQKLMWGEKRTTHVTDSVNRYEAQHSETKEDKFALESRLRSNGCRRGESITEENKIKCERTVYKQRKKCMIKQEDMKE